MPGRLRTEAGDGSRGGGRARRVGTARGGGGAGRDEADRTHPSSVSRVCHDKPSERPRHPPPVTLRVSARLAGTKAQMQTQAQVQGEAERRAGRAECFPGTAPSRASPALPSSYWPSPALRRSPGRILTLPCVQSHPPVSNWPPEHSPFLLGSYRFLQVSRALRTKTRRSLLLR